MSILWRNPWIRFAVPGLILLVAAASWGFISTSGFTSQSLFLALASLPFVYTAVKYFRIGANTGGLYSFFSEKGFGVGCDADRLCIPYSEIQLPERVAPSTVNENYIVLPVKADAVGIIVESKDGTDRPWDGKPYQRGIVSVVIKDGVLQARAYPNEMIVQLFCAIYPLSMFLKGKPAEEQLASERGVLRPRKRF